MKLTELDRIYFLQSGIYNFDNGELLRRETHLCYMLDGDIRTFCDNRIPQFIQKYKSLSPSGKCSMDIVYPTQETLEDINAECDCVDCPDCLEIAIKGEL